MNTDELFYVGQKAFIEKNGKVLIIYDPEYGLDFPGGKIQVGETNTEDPESLMSSLEREVLEETNLEIKIGQPFYVWVKSLPKSHRLFPKKVYLVGFKCQFLAGDMQLSDAHNKFKWVDKNNYMTLDDGSSYFEALKKYFEGE